MPYHILDSVILDHTKQNNKPIYSVIWLHGLGADGHDFVPIVSQFNNYDILDKYNIRFIFPHAPKIPISINNNYVMHAWFDIYGLDKNSQEDATGIQNSRGLINNLIEEEHKLGIAYNNIIIAGFSQGGALALYTGLSFEHKLAGIMGLSCYLPRFDQKYSLANKDTKIFLAHGSIDPIVKEEYGQSAYNRLLDLKYNTAWHSYPMAHQVCSDEIQDIELFIDEVLKN